MQTPPIAFKDLIRARRMKLGHSRKEVAIRMAAAGMPIAQSTIREYEQGSIPETPKIRPLAIALDLPPAQLLVSLGVIDESESLTDVERELLNAFRADNFDKVLHIIVNNMTGNSSS